MKTYTIETWLSERSLSAPDAKPILKLENEYATDAAAKRAAFAVAKRQGRTTTVTVDGKLIAVR